MKQLVTFFKYVNQPVMNAAQKKVENDKKKYSIVQKSNLILKKDMEHKEITREKKKNMQATV